MNEDKNEKTARNDKMNQAFDMIKSTAENFRKDPKVIAEFLEFGSRFYEYSVNNAMMIYAQNQHATYVQSFKAWKDDGYHVKKGQKGIKVLVPMTITYLNENNKNIKLSEASNEIKRRYKAGEIEGYTKLVFGVGNVFDISQTNCQPRDYPRFYSMGYESQKHGSICQALKNFSSEVLNVPVEDKDLQSISLRGYYNKNEIYLNEKLMDTEKLSTLAHELGHAMVDHRNDDDKSLYRKEFEADAVSILLQSDMGLEISDIRKLHLASNYKKLQKEIDNFNDQNDTNNIIKIDDILKDVYSIYNSHKSNIDNYIDDELGKERYIRRSKSKKKSPSDILAEKSKKMLEHKTNEVDIDI